MEDYRMELPLYPEKKECQNCFEIIRENKLTYEDKPFCSKRCALENAIRNKTVDIEDVGKIIARENSKGILLKDLIELINAWGLSDIIADELLEVKE